MLRRCRMKDTAVPNIPAWWVVWLAPIAVQLLRPVGGEQDERHTGVVRLEHSRVQVGHGRAGGRHNEHRRLRLDGDPEREESSYPLVDPHSHPDQPGPLEVGCGERERLRARSGAHDDVADAATDEFLKQCLGELTGRALPSHRPGRPSPWSRHRVR